MPLIVALALLGPTTAQAVTLQVPSSYPNVRSAMALARSGDIIRVDSLAYVPELQAVTVPAGLQVTLESTLGASVTRCPPLLVEGDLTLAGFTFLETDLLSLTERDNALVYVGGGRLVAEDLLLDPSASPGGALGLLAEDSADIEVSNLRASGFTAPPVWIRDGTSFVLRELSLEANGAPLALAGGLVLEGAGTGVIEDSLFADGSGLLAGAILVVDQPAVVTLRRVDFRDNRGDAGSLWVDQASVVLEDPSFQDGVGATAGEVVLTGPDAELAWTGGSAEGSAGVEAGVLANLGARLTLDGVQFANTQGERGGVLLQRGGTSDLLAVTARSTSATDGGFLSLEGGVSLLTEPLLDLNAALGGGGALQVVEVGDTRLTLAGGRVLGAHAGLQGGALYQRGGEVRLEAALIADASAPQGGAVFATDGDLHLEATLVIDGVAEDGGGAIWAEGQALSLRHTTLRGNRSTTGAGALHLQEATTAVLERSRVCTSVAGFGSAAVVVDDWGSGSGGSHLTSTNTVFLGNGDGGVSAIAAAVGADQVTLVNNTFAGNLTSRGVVRVEAAPTAARLSLELTNNLVVESPLGVEVVSAPAQELGGYNLWWEVATIARGTTRWPAATDLEVDPLLADYRPGDCDSDLTLAPGSPARDAGDPTLTDPDGSRSDIGAYGGPDADLEDADGDGWYEDQDCDDDDPSVHPGADDTSVDGVDQDCDGVDGPGGAGTDTDTDTDTDADPGGDPGTLPGGTRPDGTEDPSADADGPEAAAVWLSGGCACDHPSRSTPGLAPLLLLLTLLARRRSA